MSLRSFWHFEADQLPYRDHSLTHSLSVSHAHQLQTHLPIPVLILLHTHPSSLSHSLTLSHIQPISLSQTHTHIYTYSCSASEPLLPSSDWHSLFYLKCVWFWPLAWHGLTLVQKVLSEMGINAWSIQISKSIRSARRSLSLSVAIIGPWRGQSI